jgi:(p)ppGpp synthase/HD superfamily hydrolase
MDHATLFAKFSEHMTSGELMDADLADMIAKYAYRAQVRKELGPDGRPLRSLVHARRAAAILWDLGGVHEPAAIYSCILHDSLEDAPRYVTQERLIRWFGSTVARTVCLVSKVPPEGYIERMDSDGDWRVVGVKSSDRLDNMRSLGLDQVGTAFRAKQIIETREVYLPLFERMLSRCPNDVRPGIGRIVSEIQSIVEGAGPVR